MKKSAILILLLLLICASTLFAQTPQMTNGLTYLTSTQSPDGSWGNEATGTEILPSTIAAIEALKALNQTNTLNYTNSLVWLQSQGLQTTDYFSERIHALMVSGADKDVLLSYLDDLIGAWGGYNDYEVNNLDTALALQALKAVNYQDQDTISYALAYLQGTQNADGGWGFYQGDDSNVYMTAIVLQTLAQFKTTYDLQAPITDSATYLLTKQNPEGGFGSSPSTVYETALAFEVLIASGAVGANKAANMQNAVTYLSSTQLANGSWEDDPYSTALALRALADVKPNLTISSADIIFSNPAPTRGETVTIFTTIHNKGTSEASSILVRFFEGDPNGGGIQIGNDQIISSLSPYGSSSVSVSYNTTGKSGRKEIFVKVDPLNNVAEALETDNIARAFLTISLLPDISLSDAEISYTPDNPTPDAKLDITFSVRNLGEKTIENVPTRLYRGQPGAGGVELSNYTIRTLAAKGGFAVIGTIYNPQPGVNNYYLVADPGNLIEESNESNNIAGIAILVNVTKAQDLAIFPQNISFSRAANANPGEPMMINAVVSNTGSYNLTTDVAFYDGDPASGGVLIGRQTITLPPIGNQLAQMPWIVPTADRTVYVVVDPDDTVNEMNEANNVAYRSVFPGIPDLVVRDAGITFLPANPTPRSKVTITALVSNFGGTQAYPYLYLYEGLPEAGGRLVGSFQFPPNSGILEAYGSLVGTLMMNSLTIGRHEFYVVADPNNIIDEFSEANNRGKVVINVTNDPKTDLYITQEDITFSSSLPVAGQQTTINARVSNTGGESAFTWVAFYNGDPTSGGQLIGKVQKSIPQEWSATASFVFTMPQAIPNIFVVVDESNQIAETDETNNRASRTIDTYKVDLWVNPGDISLNPVLPIAGDVETVEVKVHSSGTIPTSATLRLYEGLPSSGRLIGSQNFTIGIQTVQLSFPGYIYPGDGATLTAVIENGSPSEADFENNRATAIFGDHAADGASNEGTDFWLAFPYVYYTAADIVVQSKYPAKATVKGPGFEWKGEVSPGFPARIPVQYYAAEDLSVKNMITSDSVVENKGIHVTSDQPVSVIFHSPLSPIDADDSYLALPTGLLGTEYYFLSYTASYPQYFPSLYVIIATEDNTNVQIRSSLVDTVINMNKGQTYQVLKNAADHSGTHVRSDRPVAYIAGVRATNVPNIMVRAADTLLEQLLPISLWGTDHFTSPLYSPGSSDVFRVLAARDNTEITVKDKYYTKTYSLNAGQWVQYENEVAAHITSNNPVTVAQFAKGKDAAGVGDPFQLTIIPTDKLRTEHRFYTYAGYEEGDYVTIIAPDYGATVKLDGSIITSDWAPLPDRGQYVLVSVLPGEHTVTSDKPVAVYAHGYRDYGSYGYPAGIGVSAPNLSVSEMIITPSNPTEGQLVEISAVITNQGEKWANNVVVRAYNGDPLSGGMQIGSDLRFDILYPKEAKAVTFLWDTYGYRGVNNLFIVVDPLDTVKELTETDNTAMIQMTLPEPARPDLTIAQAGIHLTPVTAAEGQSSILSVTIKNRGAAVGDFSVALYIGDPNGEGIFLEKKIIRPIIPLNGEVTIDFTINTVGLQPVNTLTIFIDPDNIIDESDEANNTASQQLTVIRKKMILQTLTDKAAYPAQDTVGIGVLLKNEGAVSWSGTAVVTIEDSLNRTIAQVATIPISDLRPYGIEGWSFRAPITVTAGRTLKDAIATSPLNLGTLLASLGMTNKTVDFDSLRVTEFDAEGNFIGEKKVRFEKDRDFDPVAKPSGRLLWLMDGITQPTITRLFYLYFDTTDQGPKTPSLNTSLPEKGRLIAFSGYWGDLYTVTSNADGTFGSKVAVGMMSNSLLYGITLNDFNNDGFPDLIAGDENRDIYYFRNRADGSDTFLPKVKIGNIVSGTVLQQVTSADYNNDGNQDLILNMYNYSSATVPTKLYVLLGNGDGTFLQSTITLPSGMNVRGKTSGDFNKDGKVDLVIGDNTGMLWIYYGNGDGTFDTPVAIRSIGKEVLSLAAADFDSDEYLDIIATGMPNDGIAYIVKGIQGNEFKPVEELQSLKMPGRSAYSAVDINGDGKVDVLAAQITSGNLVYFEGNGYGTFKPAVPVAVTSPNAYATSVNASRINPEAISTIGLPEKILSISYNFTWNTGSTSPGNYKVHVTLSEGQGIVAEDYSPFEILPDTAISSRVVTDRIAYIPNQPVTMTATITSLSANYIFENLTAKIAVSDQQSAIGLHMENISIPILMPGQITEFKTYWNTATYPAGAYPVTLEIRDASGVLLSTSTATLTISDEIKPSKLLRGQISVDRQSILQGEPLSISYQVTNIGNLDLSQVDLSIKTVHVVNLSVYDTLTDQTALVKGSAYANAQQLGTGTYSAKDYLVILTASINGVEESLASTYFRIEGAPSAPSLNAPAHASDVETATPALSVNNATDPNDDRLRYEFELYSDANLTTLIASSGLMDELTSVTSWQEPVVLQENGWYFWRARAYDNRLYGQWMDPAAFRVNVTNEPPTAPTLSAPAEDSYVDTLTPVLTVNNATDPDSANLTYNFAVASDPGLSTIVTSQVGVFEMPGSTSYQVPVVLQENTWYYWTAQADDWLIIGPWMTTARFFVNTANEAPTAPAIIDPTDNSEIASRDVVITVSNSTDPDSPSITYVFEVDSALTFDTLDRVISGSVQQGQNTTSWPAAGLKDNTYYYARVKASDGSAESPLSAVIGFFVNTQNDAPTVPVLANPSNGAGVNSFNPILSVHNATDLDGDMLAYEFEVYADAAMTNLISSALGIQETSQVTGWTVPVTLTENSTYFWRARAFDGELYSPWIVLSSFTVNTANDAPTAPSLYAPAQGSSLSTLTPMLSINNATDPDSDTLTYDFEIYTGTTLVRSLSAIPQDASGITSVTLSPALSDNTTYTWRARAYDGDRYGAWMDMATFSIHLPSQNITATIDFDPNTLNQKSKGNWVTVYIELPVGYNVANINISSLRLNGTIPAVTWPYAIGDYDHDAIPDLMVKFDRNAVINLLPNGDRVKVTVTGNVGATTFEGVDYIRVIH